MHLKKKKKKSFCFHFLCLVLLDSAQHSESYKNHRYLCPVSPRLRWVQLQLLACALSWGRCKATILHGWLGEKNVPWQFPLSNTWDVFLASWVPLRRHTGVRRRGAAACRGEADKGTARAGNMPRMACQPGCDAHALWVCRCSTCARAALSLPWHSTHLAPRHLQSAPACLSLVISSEPKPCSCLSNPCSSSSFSQTQ